MKSRTVLSIFAFASILSSLAPIASQADSEMDACIEAFVADRVPKDRAIKIRKLEGSSPSMLAPHSRRITVTATGAKSGTRIASASCVVSERDGSIALVDIQAPSKIASVEQHSAGT
jgi:hypothetical protein